MHNTRVLQETSSLRKLVKARVFQEVFSLRRLVVLPAAAAEKVSLLYPLSMVRLIKAQFVAGGGEPAY